MKVIVTAINVVNIECLNIKIKIKLMENEIYIEIWNGIINDVKKPDDVRVRIRDYDKHCCCDDCLEDQDGDRYHEYIYEETKTG